MLSSLPLNEARRRDGRTCASEKSWALPGTVKVPTTKRLQSIADAHKVMTIVTTNGSQDHATWPVGSYRFTLLEPITSGGGDGVGLGGLSGERDGMG
jgi:hypothetical protein